MPLLVWSVAMAGITYGTTEGSVRALAGSVHRDIGQRSYSENAERLWAIPEAKDEPLSEGARRSRWWLDTSGEPDKTEYP